MKFGVPSPHDIVYVLPAAPPWLSVKLKLVETLDPHFVNVRMLLKLVVVIPFPGVSEAMAEAVTFTFI